MEENKKELTKLPVRAETLWKQAKPVLELGVGLLLVGLGTAIAAAEYFIEKTEKRDIRKDP